MRGTEGRLVGRRYRLGAAVGRGGMGRVWRALDETLDREVAVKELLIPGGLSPQEHDDLTARTMREARAAGRLRHPGIITIHDVVEDDGVPWVVMEFIDGPSLAKVIQDEGRLDWARVAEIGADLADALAHAHSQGIVHRDLKPDNVLLAGRRPIITDFGIARIMDVNTRITHTGVVIGTPKYMSPEQLENRSVEAPSDVWSLGVTLYSAVEGRAPFDGGTLTSLVTAILTQPLPPPEHAGPMAPALIATMAKDAGRRPDAVALQGMLRMAGERSVPVRTPVAFPDPAPTVAYQPTYAQTSLMPHSPTEPELRPELKPEASGPRRRAILGGAVAVVAVGGAAIAAVEALKGSGRGTSSSLTGDRASSTPTTPQTDTSTKAAVLNPPAPVAFTGHTDKIFSVVFNPAAAMMATASADKTVRLWDVDSHSEIAKLTGHVGAVYSVAFSPDGSILASGGADGTVRLWDVAGAKPLRTLRAPASSGLIGPVAFNPTGTMLAGGSEDGSIRVWKVGGSVQTILTGHSKLVESVAFSLDGGKLASGSDDRTARIWDLADGSSVVLTGHTDNVQSVAFSPDSATLGTASFDKTARLWSVSSHGPVGTLLGHTDHLESVTFNHDGSYAATASWDKTTRVWDPRDQRQLVVLAGHSQPVESVAFSHDGSSLASCGWDRTILVWKLT